MRIQYKGYTLMLDFSKDGLEVPVYVEKLDLHFDDISKAKNYIDTLILRGGK